MPTPLDRRRFLARSAASAAALLASCEGFAEAAATEAPAAAVPVPPPAPAASPRVVRLGQNENPWGPSEAARRAAAEAVSAGNRSV
ncbi:MAG: aminotransferase, partial [Thermoanaerobaculia bacterium]|nr:aminotransferase [Thermoanaerobaculia bacterium]